MKQSGDPQTRYDFLFIARPKKYRRTKSSPWKGILSCSRFSSPACVAGSNMPKTGVGTFAIVVDSKSVKAAFQSIGGTMEAVQNAAGAYGVGCTRWKAFSTIDPVLILGFSRWPAVQDRREPSDGQRIFPQTRKQSKRQPQPVLTAGRSAAPAPGNRSCIFASRP
jgi:hypothetical protein